jgi:hypothetical protein
MPPEHLTEPQAVRIRARKEMAEEIWGERQYLLEQMTQLLMWCVGSA